MQWQHFQLEGEELSRVQGIALQMDVPTSSSDKETVHPKTAVMCQQAGIKSACVTTSIPAWSTVIWCLTF